LVGWLAGWLADVQEGERRIIGTGERRTYWNWRENVQELGRGELWKLGRGELTGTGERTSWNWGKENVQELGRGEL